MTYAYVIVIYVTYIQIFYSSFYLAMGCQKTCGGRFLYIKIFLATLYIIKYLLAFDEHVHLSCNSQIYYVTIR